MILRPGSARKPGLGLGLGRLRLDETVSPTRSEGSGLARVGLGLSPGFSGSFTVKKYYIIAVYICSLRSLASRKDVR